MTLPSAISKVSAEAVPTVTSLFKAYHVALSIETPAPFVPCNPSILYDGGKWLCSVRAVDYRLGIYCASSSSRNYLAYLSEEFSIDRVLPILDMSDAPKSRIATIHGYEDLRLYKRGEEVCALATCCDLANGCGLPEMVVLTLDGHRIVSVRPLRGPWSRSPQKNWTIVADGTGERMLYRVLPTLEIRPDDHVRAWLSGGPGLDNLEYLPSSVRGSSQAIPCEVDGMPGWLVIIHEHASKSPMVYHHRFIWLDSAMAPQKMTRAFVWRSTGVEFCAGLASDGNRLVASYGVHDREAHLAVLDASAVAAELGPIAMDVAVGVRSR